MEPEISGNKWRAIALLALCEVLALSLWFSATALIPVLKDDFGLSGFHASLFTSAVAVGFVIGTLISALFSLADRIPPKHFFAGATLIAAIANLSIIFMDPLSPMVIVMRLLTGICMAGIYPVGMKMVSTWAEKDTGLLVGLLVGALTLGSAAPHILNLLDT
ncbi:MAG: MFS transporter, partial [Sneathiella sp.]